jgi:hypothetical protein
VMSSHALRAASMPQVVVMKHARTPKPQVLANILLKVSAHSTLARAFVLGQTHWRCVLVTRD